MKVEMAKCDTCIYEKILQDMPDYPGERPGYMPIWAMYDKVAREQLCVTSGDSEYEAVCLNHLGLTQMEVEE